MKYISILSCFVFLCGCNQVEIEQNKNLSAPDVCNKRQAINDRKEKFEMVFMACMSSPKRIQTHNDDESDVVEECRITASWLYGVDYREDEFMRNTDSFIPECNQPKQNTSD